MEETLILVEDLEALSRVKDYLLNPEFEFVAYDCETTGLTKTDEMVGFSLACETGVGIYVVLAEWDKENKTLVHYDEIKQASREIIEILKTKKLIMHNSPFDCEVARREFGIELMDSVHTDTMELSHLLDENESCGLKQVGTRLFGGDAQAESLAMKASVIANGGRWVESGKNAIKEMYKADKELLGKYGAKDTILTLSIFYTLVPKLVEEDLDKFFYEEESMPLMRGPTYDMNTIGLRVDVPKLKALKVELHEQCSRLKAEIEELVEKYTTGNDWPFAGKKGARTKFSITSNQHLAWLLFIKLENVFGTLTKGGKAIAKDIVGKVPYSDKAKREFIRACIDNEIKPWRYLQCDSATLECFENKYLWVKKILELRGAAKILSTYVDGILSRVSYGVINPGFKQHGTTSGRYSSVAPNFQNLPRTDKRIKSCIISRPGKVFVGADYSQLEPRVFASVSQDETLMSCFAKGEDFYSVVGIPIFDKYDSSPYKKDPNSFASKYEELRDVSKAFALASPYGTSAFQQAQKLGRSQTECQSIIDRYFAAYPSVQQMMLNSHIMAKKNGVVYSLFGRPRRIPDAMKIPDIYGDVPHGELPYEARTLLNLAMNHRVQGTAASIVNRAAIAFNKKVLALGLKDAKIVLQVHDELVVECKEEDAQMVAQALKDVMENTTTLPGVQLVAEPKIANNLAELK